MPNRMIRHGYLDSGRVEQLTPQSERLYFRMLIACDDAGRLDGRTAAIASACLPSGGEVTAEHLRRIADAGLIVQYQHAGQPYIQILRTQRMGPGKRAKFPWKDGSYEIAFVERETAEGPKQFVITSIPPDDGKTQDAPPVPPSADASVQPEPVQETKPCPKGYGKWTFEEFETECHRANGEGADRILYAPELQNFIEYWTEPDKAGRMKFQTMKTWATRLRMRTALRMIYLPNRPSPQPGTNRTPVSRVASVAELQAGRKP